MSEMTDEEYEYTREYHTHDIRKKSLMDCSAKELRIRCNMDEEYIKKLEKRVKRLSTALYDNGILVHIDEED